MGDGYYGGYEDNRVYHDGWTEKTSSTPIMKRGIQRNTVHKLNPVDIQEPGWFVAKYNQ